MTTFLHAADIHLDSPLVNLRLDDELGAAAIRGATRQALDNLVELALNEQVDFLLLAGDLYDGPWRDFNTGLFFIDRMQRLRKAGIRVFLIAGNHDAASRITRALRLPDNVTLFPAERAQTEILEETGVAIHGRSYSRRAETDNLALTYPDPVPGLLNIGLLHTALTGRQGHAPYAPCSLEDLRGRGYNYWALGHVHQYEILHRDPWIVFAGTPQGRHIREAGPHGCCLVRAEAGQITEVAFTPLDAVRWQQITVHCAGVANSDVLRERIEEALNLAGDGADGRSLVARVILEGPCVLHGHLLAEQVFWENEIRALATSSGDIFLESLHIRTSPANTGKAGPAPAIAIFAKPPQSLAPELVDDIFASPPLKALERSLPPEIERTDLFPLEEEHRRALLARAGDLIQAALDPTAGDDHSP